MKTIIPAQTFPVSLSEAKHQLGFFHSEDDDAVQALIAMATEEAEDYTGLTTLFKTVEEKLADFPAGIIVLTGKPYAKLNSIKYYDEDNSLQTLSANLYRVYNHKLHAEIEIIDSWPATYDRQDAITIEYVIGHAGTATATDEGDLITMVGHPFADNDRVTLYKATDGTLPAGVTERRIYYVISATADTFQLSTEEDGSAIEFAADSEGQWYVGFQEVPRVMKQAIQMTIANCNEYRMDEVTGTIVSQVMMSSRYLLNQVKPKRL